MAWGGLGAGTRLAPGSVIHGPALIGERCWIGDGVEIGPNVTLGDDVVNAPMMSFDESRAAFRCGQGAPPTLAALMGDALTDLVLRKPCRLAETGLSRTTRKRHRRALRDLRDNMAAHRCAVPFAQACVEHLNHRHVMKSWSPTTRCREMGNLMGALQRLSYYSTHPTDLILKQSPIWRDAIRAAEKDARGAGRKPKAMSPEQFQQVLDQEPDPQIKCLLILTWVVAARGGDVCKLKTSEILLRNGNELMITFNRGKGPELRKESYIVHSALSAENAAIVSSYLEARTNNTWAFAFYRSTAFRRLVPKMLISLRRVDPALEQKSMRRGATQALSRALATREELMHFTGHKTEKSLNIYLAEFAPHAPRARELGRRIQQA